MKMPMEVTMQVSKEQIESRCKALDVQYIVYNGYYSNADDGEQLHPHSAETLALYKQAFEQTHLKKEMDFFHSDSTFNGVCFDENDKLKFLAEWYFKGETHYYEILLN